jgi:uncharacterized phiE125 gp8 family phage protein
MRYERTTTGALPISITALADFIRVAIDDRDLWGVARTACDEVEAYCDLALTEQTIEATTDDWPGSVITLPVGPLADDPHATVELLELDGTTTEITTGFWFEAGRYPRLHFTEGQPGGRIRVTYNAGFGPDDGSVPAALQHACMDHAGRLYDMRGCVDERRNGAGLSPHAARIVARYRRVSL